MEFFFRMAWMVGVIFGTRGGEVKLSTMLLRDEHCDHGYWLGHQMKIDATYACFVWLLL